MGNPLLQAFQQQAGNAPQKSGADLLAGFQQGKKPAAKGSPAAPPEQPQKLPEGAKGFDAFGNPYFGDGLQGILKKWKYNFTKDVKPVDQSGWDELKARWQNVSNQSVQAQKNDPSLLSADRLQLSKEAGSIAGEAVSKGYQDMVASAQGSLLNPILKGIGASVTSLGELFSLPAQKVEQGSGALQGLREAARGVEGPLPKLEQNWFTDMVESTPLGIAYDVSRIALSPSDNKWEYAGQKIQEGWQSGRIFYSQMLDATLKEEFLTEYRAGADPGLLAIKLQNPLAELAGQLILDPLNLVGAFSKGAKTAAQLDRITAETASSGLLKLEKGAAALEEVSKAQDTESSLKALDTLAQAQREAVDLVQSESKLLNVRYGITDLTTTSRQNALIAKGSDLLGNMALALKQNGMNNEAVAEMMLYGAKSVSKDVNEMKVGLAGIANAPNANLWLSDDYLETFTLVHNLLDDGNGVLNGAKLKNLIKASNPAEFAEAATNLLAAAAKTQFPDVSEMEKAAKIVTAAEKAGTAESLMTRTRALAQKYEQLPNHVKFLNKTNDTLQKGIRPINSFFSTLYFNLQGGVAVKNVANNNELILLDQGVKAWFKDGEYWTRAKNVKYLEETFEELPQTAHGFKTLVSSVTEKKPLLFGKLMEAGEEEGAARVVASSVRDTFEKMIPKAMPNMAAELDAGVLTQGQVDRFARLLYKNKGNAEKATEEFRNLYKLGAVEDWRNLDFVSDFERKALEKLDYWDDIEELAARGGSQADVEEAFAKIAKSIDSRSELATRDVIGLSQDHPNAEAWADLAKAVDEGHLDPGQQQVFTAVMEYAEQARLEYQDLLDDVAQKAMNALSREGKMAESQKIGEEMNRVRKVLRDGMPATARETQKMTQDAWRWSDAVKGEKKLTPELLADYWRKAGLTGEPPLDLNKQSLLKQLWEERFAKVSDTWNSSFDSIVGESETVLKQMGKFVDTTELDSMATRTRHITQQAQAMRSAAFDGKMLRINPAGDIAFTAKQYGVKPEEILQAINNKLPDGAQAFGKIEDVPTEQVMGVLENLRAEKGLPPMKGIAVPPPHPLGGTPSLPRAWNESSKGAKYLLDQIKNEIVNRWGKFDDSRAFNPQTEKALQKMAAETAPKMNEIKAVALKVAQENRNFTLLNYGAKTYGDVALAYLMPYHFFYTRSYKNWVSRVFTNPEIMAGYGKYKNALEKMNSDLPEWYKQQIDVTKMLGIETDHPMFLNLEATFNPLYGLTGTDFNDPAKRVNWAAATFDDMGKFGPTIWSPLQMATAAMLYKNGETDAASRWGTRIIPETAQIKALTSYFGNPVELDPNVQMFSGNGLFDFAAMDPYERGRMGYAAAGLINSGQFTAEQLQQQFQAQAGEGWDAARTQAVQSRAGSSFSSYFLGVGFKPRSQNDVMVEKMYTDLNKLYSMSDTMSPDDYRGAWEELRNGYPPGLVDTVLLAKKGGPKRDAAYAYNVLGRLPPGKMDDVLRSVGISSQELSKFYESKGFSSDSVKFTDTEKQRFMAAVIDLGTMLKIPQDATRQEWNDARGAYSDALENVKQQYGKDIWDKVSHYYDLKDDNKDAAEQFKQQHPEVAAALQSKGSQIANSPLLSAYYGGIENIEMFVSGQVRNQLEEKYGRDIYQVQTDYYNADNPRQYLAQHPELKQFWADKRGLDKQAQAAMLKFASALQQPKAAEFRGDFTPESYVQEQLYKSVQSLAKKGQAPAWEEVSQGMPDWLQREVVAYWQNGGQGSLSKRAAKEMDFLAKQGGYYNANDLLMSTGYAIQSIQNTPAAQQSQREQLLAAFSGK